MKTAIFVAMLCLVTRYAHATSITCVGSKSGSGRQTAVLNQEDLVNKPRQVELFEIDGSKFSFTIDDIYHDNGDGTGFTVASQAMLLMRSRGNSNFSSTHSDGKNLIYSDANKVSVYCTRN